MLSPLKWDAISNAISIVLLSPWTVKRLGLILLGLHSSQIEEPLEAAQFS